LTATYPQLQATAVLPMLAPAKSRTVDDRPMRRRLEECTPDTPVVDTHWRLSQAEADALGETLRVFVEEMTKAVMEAGSERAAQRTAAAIPSPNLAVPASLQASLMARLDRLGPAKEIAQIGAAIGREFSHALLAAVTRKPEAELASALDRLIAAGLLFRQGVPPHAGYLFKHALVQDAAYGTLLREPRRAFHAAGYPAKPLVSFRINRQLSGWNLPPLMIRAFGALGQQKTSHFFWGWNQFGRSLIMYLPSTCSSLD
jgi:hypothetical protein